LNAIPTKETKFTITQTVEKIKDKMHKLIKIEDTRIELEGTYTKGKEADIMEQETNVPTSVRLS
jgi:hypothetical protein